MTATLYTLGGILLRRAHTAALPSSLRILLILIVADVILTIVAFDRLDEEGMTIRTLFLPVAVAGLQAAVIYQVMRTKQVLDRFLRTAIAYFGINLYLSLAALFLLSVLGQISSLPILFLVIWSTYVLSTILADAIDTNLLVGFLFFLGLMGVSAMMTWLIEPSTFTVASSASS